MWPRNDRRPPRRPARAAVLLLLATACASCTAPQTAPPDPATRSLHQACRYLWGQQAEDGGWHSQTYALLRSGQALTPFVLHALLECPEQSCPRPQGGVEKALQFIRGHVNADGVIGLTDPDILEYPNYSTAYALRCLVLTGDEGDRPLIVRMRDYLADQQYRDENGFPPSELVFGGWGFGGPVAAGAPGHMDLPHSRRVLQALRESGLEDEEVYRRAQVFLRLLQRHPDETRPQPLPPGEESPSTVVDAFDGGFYFSPIVLAGNKANLEHSQAGAYFRSYATTTSDGILALLAAGVSPQDERVTAAKRWLAAHPRWDYPQGIPEDHPEGWGRALHFYHLAVRAEAYQALNWEGDWGREVVQQIVPQQNPDGSFVNLENSLMKEDDPLLCTTLAVTALWRGESHAKPQSR